jgi:hypothetical protein
MRNNVSNFFIFHFKSETPEVNEVFSSQNKWKNAISTEHNKSQQKMNEKSIELAQNAHNNQNLFTAGGNDSL